MINRQFVFETKNSVVTCNAHVRSRADNNVFNQFISTATAGSTTPENGEEADSIIQQLYESLNSIDRVKRTELQRIGLEHGSEMAYSSIRSHSSTIVDSEILRYIVRDLKRVDSEFIEVHITWTKRLLNVKTMDNFGKNELDLTFNLSKDERLWKTTTVHGLVLELPTNVNEKELMFLVRGLWLIRSYVGYLREYRSSQTAKGFASNSSQATLGVKWNSKSAEEVQNVDKAHCLNHDLLCTLPPQLADTLGWLGINVHLSGKIQSGAGVTYMLDCCHQHDIDLWCSRFVLDVDRPPGDRSMTANTADIKVIFCMLAKLERLTDSSNWLFNLVTKTYFYLVYGALASLAVALTTWSAAAHDPALLNLDGRNSKSCLCGGTEPTVLCNNKCRDLCREFRKKVECNQFCTYSCDYDRHGRLLLTPRQLINNSGLPCCPTTIKPCKEPKPCASQNCNDCKWYCVKCEKFDKNCPDGYRSHYGREYEGRDYSISDKCCPERTAQNSAGSQPYEEGIKCPSIKREGDSLDESDVRRRLY